MSAAVVLPLSPESVFNTPDFEAAIHDTPIFRANIRKVEEQVDHFEKWLEGFWKALRHYVDESSKLTEASGNLVKRALHSSVEDSILDRDFTFPTVRVLADTFQTTLAFKAKLVNDIEERLIQPLAAFMKNDLKDFKETRRAFDKALEKYDNTLTKYASQSKTKEASALREDAFQLFEIRKTYIRIALDYTLKIIQFRTAADHLTMEIFLGGTCAHLDFYNANAMIYSGSENQMNILKSWLWESKKCSEIQIPVIRDLKKKLEDEAINMNKPQRTLTTYKDNTTNAITIHPVSEPLQNDSSSSIKTDNIPFKQGYLFMKPLNGKGNWSRKYFYLQDGIFWWASTGQGKQRSTIEESERIGVLLCEVRVDTLQDRRSCFEIVCGAKSTSWVLQAETELELKDWIASFESAKRHAFSSSSDLTSSAAAAVSSQKEPKEDTNLSANEEDEQSKNDPTSLPKSSAENSQNVTLELPTSESRRNSVNNTNKRHSFSALSTTAPASRPPLHNSNTLPLRNQGLTIANNSNNGIGGSQPVTPLNQLTGGINEKASSSSTSSNQQNFWGSIQWNIMPAMNMLINSVNGSEGDGDEDGENLGEKRKGKKNRSRSGSGPVGSGIDGSIAEYPQTLMAHNSQLHLLFKNMSEKEFLLDVYQCGLVKDGNLFRGRVYFTQDRLSFYSMVMGVINTFCIPWREIKSVVLEATNPQQTVMISDESGKKYTIKIFLGNSRSFYDKVQLAWKLATDEKVKSLQSIYDALWKPNTPPHINEFSERHNSKLTEPSEVETPHDEALSSGNYIHELGAQSETGSMHSKGYDTGGNDGGTFSSINREDNSFSPGHEELQNNQKNKEDSYLVAPKYGPFMIHQKEDEDYPPDMNLPESPISCECFDHPDKLEVDVEYHVPARKLYQILFDENSSLWERMHQKERHTLQHVGSWVMGVDGVKQREFRLIIPINGSTSKSKETKETEFVETHTFQKCDEYMRYVVLVQTKPVHNDSPISMSKWCITYETKTSCKLVCHVGIKPVKVTTSRAARKAALARLTDTVADIIELLNADVARGKSKGFSNSSTRSTTTLRRRTHHRQHKNRNHSTVKHTVSGEDSISGSAGPINRTQESNVIAHLTPSDDNKYTGTFSTILMDPMSNIYLRGLLLAILVLLFASNIYSFVYSKNYGRFSESSMRVVPSVPAVYIRDLEEQVFNISSEKGLYNVVDPESYSQFLDTRTEYPPYSWLLYSSRRLSEEIKYARKRVAVIRYDLLLTFRLINSIDSRLIKREYVNWLLDERAKCSKAKWMFLKDDITNEDENLVIHDKVIEGCNEDENGGYACENGEDCNEKTNEGIKMKCRSEYKSILKYCENVKRQLSAFGNTV